MIPFANNTKDSYRPEILSESDILDCIELIIRCFPLQSEVVRQWFERRIANNPWQRTLPGIGVGIRDGGRLVAFRALFGQPWWLNGDHATLAFAAHTAVDSNYRGYGLATKLISESTRFAAITGSATAGNITQKAYKKLGYVEAGETDNDFFRTRISYCGSLEKRLGRRLGLLFGRIADTHLERRDSRFASTLGFHFEEISRCGWEFDDLWERTKTDYVSCLEHTSAYLNWRLFDFPTCSLRLASLKDSSGMLRAYGIWHTQAFDATVRMAVLRDVFCAMKDHDALGALLCFLCSRWRKEGISWVSLEVAAPWITAFFRNLGFEHVLSHGNRYQIYSRTPLPADTMQNWFRSGIDGDYCDMSVPG